MVEIALGVDDRQGVVDEGEVDRRHRHTRAVGDLVDPQIVACQKCFFERGRGYLIVLTDEAEDEIYENKGIDDCVDPAHDAAYGLVFAFFPP